MAAVSQLQNRSYREALVQSTALVQSREQTKEKGTASWLLKEEPWQDTVTVILPEWLLILMVQQVLSGEVSVAGLLSVWQRMECTVHF